MSLRLRLILAFFLLSVVPLGALTLYAYTSNARAAREAARHEAELLAGELTQRMQVVTAQLSERVEYLMNLANATAAVDTAQQSTRETAAAVAPATELASATAASQTLSSIAMLLNNVELRDGFRGRRGGRGRGFLPPDGRGMPPVGAPPAGNGRAATSAAGVAAGPELPVAGAGTPDDARRADRARGRRGEPPAPALAPAGPGAPAPPSAPEAASRGAAADRQPPAAPEGPPAPASPAAAPDAPPSPDERIAIDMMPIRREIMQQFASQEEFAALPEAEQQRIIGEVNQRMLGIRMGIQMGTAEVQRRIADAQRAAEAKAREAAAAVSVVTAPSAASAPLQRRSTLSGSRLDVTMERNGEVVSRANAEINLQNLLGTVFSTTRRDRGEVPFAVAKDGRLYTPTDADRKIIESIGGVALRPETPPGTAVLNDWIVVTTADPTGAGLKFGIARPVGDSLAELRRTAARNVGVGLGFFGLALIGIVPLSMRLTRNLSVLSEGVRRIAQGDYRARVQVSSKDEIAQLAAAFNQMAHDVEVHQRAAIEQERIRRELELGRQIQHDMLPQVPLRLGLTEVRGVSVPAREVGGDFFNYFQLPNGQLSLLVGDVSGKGVGAALLMANIQASLRTRLALGQDLAAIARELDAEIEAGTPGGVYATLFVAMLDLQSYVLRYVNAGHNPQYVIRRDGTLEQMPSSGLPVGLLSGRGYFEQTVRLAPGDLLFFYTDGCVENENASGEAFGSDRLEELLRATAKSGTEDLLARVEREVTAFRGAREPFDDATMMVVTIG
ncbi:MAG: PP2C family protein-serine/threonine phosphatase [Acidobacteria bacterium]|nr:PP2C family protein-serine/threonine phosphatase [Acidobacteriota bacterium]